MVARWSDRVDARTAVRSSASPDMSPDEDLQPFGRLLRLSVSPAERWRVPQDEPATSTSREVLRIDPRADARAASLRPAHDGRPWRPLPRRAHPWCSAGRARRAANTRAPRSATWPIARRARGDSSRRSVSRRLRTPTSPTGCSRPSCSPTSSARRRRRLRSATAPGGTLLRAPRRSSDGSSPASADASSTRPATASSRASTARPGRSGALPRSSRPSRARASRCGSGCTRANASSWTASSAGIAVHIGARVAAEAAAERGSGVEHRPGPRRRVGHRVRRSRRRRAQGHSGRVAPVRGRAHLVGERASRRVSPEGLVVAICRGREVELPRLAVWSPRSWRPAWSRTPRWAG